jgi:hypothetical protein
VVLDLTSCSTAYRHVDPHPYSGACTFETTGTPTYERSPAHTKAKAAPQKFAGQQLTDSIETSPTFIILSAVSTAVAAAWQLNHRHFHGEARIGAGTGRHGREDDAEEH